MSRSTRLYAKHSMEELCKMLDSVPMLPNGHLRDSIHLYSKKHEKLRDDIAWAISYHMADKRRAKPTTNETRG
jgi:ABC-type Na+ transport system ATPase subunit NatA